MTARLDNLTRIWANSEIDQIGFGLNITSTGHGANSKAINVTLNNEPVFVVSMDGKLVVTNTAILDTVYLNSVYLMNDLYVGNTSLQNLIQSLIDANSNTYSAAASITYLSNDTNARFVVVQSDISNTAQVAISAFGTANSAYNYANTLMYVVANNTSRPRIRSKRQTMSVAV